MRTLINLSRTIVVCVLLGSVLQIDRSMGIGAEEKPAEKSAQEESLLKDEADSSAGDTTQTPSFVTPDGASPSLLLITSRSLEPAWVPFARWKTSTGKLTKVMSVESIDEDFKGSDIQEKIRACVLHHVEKDGVKWIVLGGDSEPKNTGTVPDRDTHLSLGRGARHKDMPTDVYYISPGEADWDADDDGVYGLLGKDRDTIAYSHPTGACIGRIPVRSAEEIKTFTNKVIAYETAYPEKDFATTLLCTCAVRHANNMANTMWNNLSPKWDGGEILKYYTNATPWDGKKKGDFALSPDNVVDVINRKEAGKIHIHGHGFATCFVFEQNKRFNAGHVKQLENDGAYFVATSVACFCGQFDTEKDPCIAESLLRAPTSGAVCIACCARKGMPVFKEGSGFHLDPRDGKTQDATTGLLTRFWQLGLSGRCATTGEAFAKAKEEFAAQGEDWYAKGLHWVLASTNLLGDPTLDMRAKSAFTPDVNAPKSLSVGAEHVEVSVDRKNLLICLWKGDELYTTTRNDEAGALKFALGASLTPGAISLTVSGANANTVVKTIEVQ